MIDHHKNIWKGAVHWTWNSETIRGIWETWFPVCDKFPLWKKMFTTVGNHAKLGILVNFC